MPNNYDTISDSKIAQLLENERFAAYVAEVAGGDPRFGLWLSRIGLRHTDLVDWPWRDAYDSGVGTGEALRQAVVADGIPLSLLVSQG